MLRLYSLTTLQVHLKNNATMTHPTKTRSSGILAHITSLPSKYGIGDLGPATYDFLEFLASANQTVWQILPLGPTDPGFSDSPYMSLSAFAGNPLLISPDLLYQEGLIAGGDLLEIPDCSPYSVDFDAVRAFKKTLIAKAFATFQAEPGSDFEAYRETTGWLQDYALFMALKEKFQGQPWYEWKGAIALRDKRELASLRDLLRQRIYYYQFEQYLFYLQWSKLQSYAKDLGIRIFGDIPIYVSLDSADVWSNQDIFQLDNNSGLPTHVAGVPPDYFSDSGQKWGNPLYRWNSGDTDVDRKLHQWWIARFHSVFQFFDMARIDHFRGFESYWSIPADHPSALKGNWHKGPGKNFFDTIFKELGPLNIIAEDLGEITDAVIALRDDLDFPGMKVLQFAFDNNPDNAFLPHNYNNPNCIVYTGTHDNNTSLGWFLSNRIDDDTRRRVKRQANREMGDHHPIHHDLIYLAMSSIAAIAITPLQDVLGFGSDCRMNTPGTASGNWVWRCGEEFLTQDVAEWLRNVTVLFRRNQLP